jgi:hypothetical protein
LKIVLCDNKGKFLYPAADGRYGINLGLGRFTGAVTAGAIFAMRNQVAASNNKVLAIHKIHFRLAFAGTLAASSQIFTLRRFNTATHGGGVAISLPAGAVKNHVNMPNSILLDARYADITTTNPLTEAGVVYEPVFESFCNPRNNGAAVEHTWTAALADQFFLHPGEGLAISITQTAVVGDILVGSVEWDEYDHDAANYPHGH